MVKSDYNEEEWLALEEASETLKSIRRYIRESSTVIIFTKVNAA